MQCQVINSDASGNKSEMTEAYIWMPVETKLFEVERRCIGGEGPRLLLSSEEPLDRDGGKEGLRGGLKFCFFFFVFCFLFQK